MTSPIAPTSTYEYRTWLDQQLDEITAQMNSKQTTSVRRVIWNNYYSRLWRITELAAETAEDVGDTFFVTVRYQTWVTSTRYEHLSIWIIGPRGGSRERKVY